MLFQLTISLLFTFLIGNVFAIDLQPISDPSVLTSVSSTSKRAASFTGDLDLQDFESFFWGAAGTFPNRKAC